MNSLNYDLNGLLAFKNETDTTVEKNFHSWIRDEIRSESFQKMIGTVSNLKNILFLIFELR